MNKFFSTLIYLSVLVMSGLGGYYVYTQTNRVESSVSTENSQSDPNQVIDFRFPDLNGTDRTLADWPDKLLIVNFWASWCAPCLKEIPDFVTLQQQFSDQNVQFVGIAVDNRAAVEKFVAATPINYPVLIGDFDALRLVKAYGNTSGGLPYTVFINTSLEKVVYRHQGPLTLSEARALILEKK